MSQPKLSIIIPALNEEEYLPKLLGSINKQSGNNIEVIVADAGSTDATSKIAAEFGAKIVEGGIPGVGRNNGAQIAQGDILIFADADVQFDDEFINRSIKLFEEGEFDLAIPLFETNHEKWRYRLLFKSNNGYKKLTKHTKFPDGTGQLVIIKREVFEDLQGYVNWKIAEDTELFWRAVRAGFNVGVINTRFRSSVRRYEKFGIPLVYMLWGVLGILMITGLYKRSAALRRAFEKMYGQMGSWSSK